ncbi:hypothetical protein ACFFKC_16590 [Pseudoduganella danionis]|uniref:DUF1640 domain-containing protein n=1 Tax=Pseudoduganella danionis TaxID=1890295 RepID=A0ABW9SS04_9BURK|nr:hypothetical protein [Pseudoduganella danionis]MTW33507.1 hypothetical protein [Pseudoduganella danionis]
MEPTANELPPQPAYHDPELRLTKLEKAVTALQCDHDLLGLRVSSGFEAAQAQLALTEEKLRREFHDGLHNLEKVLSKKIEDEAQRLENRIVNEVQILTARLDHQDTRLDRQDSRLDRMEARLDRMEARLDRMEARMDQLDAKIDQLAKWMIATQLTTIALIVGIAAQLFLR